MSSKAILITLSIALLMALSLSPIVSAAALSQGAGGGGVPASAPVAISLEPEPSSLLYGEVGLVRVQLLNSSGSPAPAPYNVTVFLTSYPSSVISHPTSVTIPEGSTSAYAWIRAGNASGIAYLTGSAEGLNESTPVEITVGINQPHLSVTLMPNSAFASVPGSPWALILVQLVDASGRPLIADSPVTVYVSSSNSSVLSVVSKTLVVEPGTDHAMGYAYMGNVNGTASVTAQAQWFLPGSATFTASNSTPPNSSRQYNSTVIYGPSAMAPGQSYPFLVAEVTDGFAIPIPSYQYGSLVPIAVTSSDPAIVNSSSVFVMPYSEVGPPAPSGYLLAGQPGSAVVTAAPHSQFEGSSAGSFVPVVEQPGHYEGGQPVQLSISGPSLVRQGSTAIYSIQLLDSSGNPAPALGDVTVYITFHALAGWSGALPEWQEVIIEAGTSHSYFNMSAQGSGNVSIVAAAEGMQPTSSTVDVLANSTAVKPVSYAIPLSISALTQSGVPLAGVGVTALSNGTEVANATTGQGGLATLYLPPGQYTIKLPNSVSPQTGADAEFSTLQPALGDSTFSLNLTSPVNVTAYYKMYYSVVATSQYGRVTGSGIYPAGSAIIVSLEPTVINGFPARHVFSGWVGTISSRDPSVSLDVNSSVYLVARWSLDWTPLYVVLAVLVLGIVAAAVVMINRARAAGYRTKA